MIGRFIARLCNGDKRETLMNSIFGNFISVGMAQRLSRLVGL